MPVLRIHHAVPDCEGWKRAFDGDPMDRKGSGVLWAGAGYRHPESRGLVHRRRLGSCRAIVETRPSHASR
jgi:hypothetical protein